MATTLLALTDKENPRTKRYATTSYSCVAQKGTIAFGVSHGFRVGDHVAVSGANEDAYNGVFEVISVDSLTAVSVLMPGAPPGAATGTPFVSRIIEAAHTGFPLLIDPKSGRLLVDGAGGGGGAGVSAPTRTDIVQLYTYDPNQGGAAWRDDRAMVKVVPDRAALLALKSPSEVVDGSLVVRLDNNLVYRFSPPAPSTATITDKNWHVVMGTIPVPDETTRQGLAHDTLTPGQIAVVANGKKVWMWTGNASRYNNGWMELTDYPARTDIRQRYVFDPEKSSGSELDWMDDRGTLEVVSGESDLHTIPLSHLMTGKLVYVQGDRTLYEFISAPTAKTNTMADWDAVELGIPEYNRQADLPQPSSTRAVEEGELALVRFHADAVTRLNQLFVVRYLNPATPNVATWMPINTEIFEKALRSDPDVPDAGDGDIQVTSEVGHFELKRYDRTAGAWRMLYSEDAVKQWIAAGNLFTGSVQEAAHGTAGALQIGNMPAQTALGATDKGHYYTWVGSSGYTLPAASIGGAASAVDGALMNPGDWLQIAETSPGVFAYTHIPGDLLAKARGDALYGLSAWAAGAHEQGTLVVFQGKVYKASRPILATDGNPQATGSGWNVVALSAGLRSVATDGDLPATASTGDVYLVINSASSGNKPELVIYDTPSGQWRPIGGGTAGSAMNLTGGRIVTNVGTPIGSLVFWPSATLPDGHLLCDGSGFDRSLHPELFTVLGKATVPDLRGEFLRAAGPGHAFDNLAKHRWTTGLPRAGLTTSVQPAHHHAYSDPLTGGGGLKSSDHWGNETYRYPTSGGGRTSDQGAHSHTVNGGDAETAPDFVVATVCIKASPDCMKLRTPPGGAPGPSGRPGLPNPVVPATAKPPYMNYLGVVPPTQPVWDAYIAEGGGRTPVKGDVFMTVGAGTPDATWTGLAETREGSLIFFDGTKWEVLVIPPPPRDDTVKNQWGAFKDANAMTFEDPPLPRIFLEKKVGTVLHLKTTIPDLAAKIATNLPIPFEWDNDAGMAGGMNNVNDGDTIEVEGEAIGSGMNGKLLKKFVGTTNGLEVMGSIFGGVVMSPHDVNRNVRMIGAVPEGIQFPAAKPNSFYVDTSDPQNGVLKFMDENGASHTVSLT